MEENVSGFFLNTVYISSAKMPRFVIFWL